jgi:hypothetical protein
MEDRQREINKEIYPHMRLSDKDWDAFKERIEKEREAALSRDFATWSDWLGQTEVALDDLRSGIAEHKPCDESLLEAIERRMLGEWWSASPDELIKHGLFARSPVERAVILWALDGLTPDGLDDLHTEVTLEQLAED